MPGISLSGLASGLDSASLVERLMQLERQPRGRLVLRESQVKARQAQLREISTKLDALASAAAALRSPGLWADGQTVESSDATKVAVRRTAGAGVGARTIEVTKLATSWQRTYDYTPQAGATTLTIGGATIALGANATHDEVVAAINGDTASPVYAAKVGTQLVLSSKTTGAAASFTTGGTATLTEDVPAGRPGVDAEFELDDDGVTRTSASNVLSSAVPGLELTLKGTTGGAVTVTVGPPVPDRAAVKDKVRAFVTAWNATVDLVRQRLTEDRVRNPTTTADATKGLLAGDTGLTAVLSTLRGTITEAFAGNAASQDQLTELGLTTGAATGGTANPDAVAGKLVLDDAKLSAALEADPTAVRRLLGGVTGTPGFAQRIEGIVSGLTGTDGSLKGRIDAAGRETTEIGRRLTEVDRRLEGKEARYKAMFAQLEKALQGSQSQGQWLASQLAGLERR